MTTNKPKPLDRKYLLLLSIIPVVFMVNLYDGLSFSDTIETEQQGWLWGHVTFEVKDSKGYVKHYSQSDNIVVNNGENCALKMLFQAAPAAAGTTVCTGANTAGFNFIGLEESGAAVAATDVTLTDPADSAGLSTYKQGTTITWTNSTGVGGGSQASVQIQAAFTNTGAAETITGAGLFNATAGAATGMFAHKLAASSATVNNGDTLTVTWTITVAGA